MKFRGFTLIELLITIAIIGILLTIGIPAMRHFIIVNRVTSRVDHIVSALNFARSEAIKHGTTVKFCKSQDHKTCGGNWANGQIIITSDNMVLRVFPALPRRDKLIWNGGLDKDDFLEFSALGDTNGQNGTFCYCPHNTKYARKIIINNTGRIRVDNAENDACGF